MTETAAPDATRAPALIEHLGIDGLTDLLQRSGFRANAASDGQRPLVQSAVQGLGFLLVPGNPARAAADRYVDFSFNCLIKVDQRLPPALIDAWNESKRFGRCFQRDGLLVLAFDVMLAGGVSDRFLLAQCEMWDRLMHDFIAHLRQTPVTVADKPV
ncbi:MAG: YbjN domain-containing protein [Gammaproteobacteria bacterium]|jgi:hypothetical protein|nr:YbjN domain-containing protein [Gammaproteobacteria bacterium]